MSTWTTIDGMQLDKKALKTMLGQPGWDEQAERTALALLVRAVRLVATSDELWELASTLVWDGVHAGYAWLDRHLAELCADEAPICTESCSAAYDRLTRAAVVDDVLAAAPVQWKGRRWVCLRSFETGDFREARLAEVMAPPTFALWRADPPLGSRNVSGAAVREADGATWFIFGQERIVRGPLKLDTPSPTLAALNLSPEASEPQLLSPELFAEQPSLLLPFA